MDVQSRVRRWRMRKHHNAYELGEVALFADCTAKELVAVAQHICPISVEPGRVVARAGEQCNQFVLVVSGEAESGTSDGSATVVGPGEMIGAAAIDPASREVATVTARTTMDLLVASRADLVRIIRLAPSVERKLMARLAPTLPSAPRVRDRSNGRGRHRPAA